MSQPSLNSFPLPTPSGPTPGIYLHIPYCKSKCHYCAFNSHAGREEDIAAYLTALDRDVQNMAEHPYCRRKIFHTLFIGGGTPTICATRDLVALIRSTLSRFPFVPQPEVTVETNPNTISLDKLVDLRQAGVTRLSIGIQSFQPDELRIIGRSHTAHQGRLAFELARKAGFANISLDLMYGLPEQTVQSWRDTLITALRLNPEHFSIYELMVEKGTALAMLIERNEVMLPAEEEVEGMERVTAALLAREGFIRYEISNYAKPGFICRHNCNYWENDSWIGLGAGATGSMSGMKFTAVRDSALYMRRIMGGYSSWGTIESLCREALFRETVIMGLRMIRGVSLSRLEQRFGFSPAAYYGEQLATLLENDLLCREGDYLRLTKKALPVANQVLSQLV